ncbi:sulfite exporter TauE/SafE family protein [Arsenicitalea aurantiaca]|uniref:Probable membrane transporter protein n=1 Tax=Arsenicitalea aurantiaca TaxID=1783274 RepID=A0A433XA50_9HYPH|nr:sulfite exporter TauE/SafE family protein [Arsenicitalea aurantiaca]RUT30977.1 sulfite exporter TauE/SafE family protein [Arsenicitalea aurantiaca]
MPFDLTSFLPEGVSATVALMLMVVSFFTSMLTATFSLGGGMLMLAALALVFPPSIVVPVLGAVQLGSNAGRVALQFPHVQWRLVFWLGIGAAVGTVVGGQFVAMLPETIFAMAIGLFIIVTTWLPQPKLDLHGRKTLVVGGAVISALSMLVGAVGPLIAMFFRGLADRRQLVATQAAAMTLQNTFKVIVFIAIGFAFADFVPLVLAMILAGLGGTALGGMLLMRVPDRAFRIGFKIVVTIVGLDLLRGAIFG